MAKCEVSAAGEYAVHAFQLFDEYNDVLLNWYFKGFKLLRRNLAKHNPGMNLEDLDFEAVDKEVEADKIIAAEDVAPREEVDEGAGGGQDDSVA